jgi:DNA-binding MurR/RpiR family transcriptional regulator
MAESVGCGVASIIRFSKNLGFKGFADMKFHIEKDQLIISKRDVGITQDDTINAVKQKVLYFDQTALEKCVLNVDNKMLEQISDAVTKAGKVYVIGCGAASGIAQAGAALFMSLGIMAFSVGDAMLQLRSAAFLQPNDTLFALSYSGYSKEVGDAMMFAKEAGATVVLITSYKNSLLGKYADYELYTMVRNQSNSINYAATSIAQLMMLQIIQAIIQQKNVPEIAKKGHELRGHSNMKYYDIKQQEIHRGRVHIVGLERNEKP